VSNGHPFVVDPQVALLGEVIAWELPAGLQISHSDLIRALSQSGLDPAAARDLCRRHAFVRACRKMAQNRIIRNLEEDRQRVTFQFTRERLQGDRFAYDFEAIVSLDKTTGAVSCTDPALQAIAVQELDLALRMRRTQDVTRLLHTLFGRHADLFTVKAGVYFVPQQHLAFLDQVGQFVVALGGQLRRYPVPEGTPQGNQSVQQIVSDGLYDQIREFEEAIAGISRDSREDTLVRAYQRIRAAEDKIETYARHLGAQRGRLEDYLAWVENLLRTKQQERQEAAATQPAA
jgi:hypothetical protein